MRRPSRTASFLIASASAAWLAPATKAGADAPATPTVSALPAPAGTEGLPVEWVKVTAPGVGVLKAAVARPSGKGPFPAVILLHGSHGFAREYVQLATELSRGGVLAVAPCWFAGGGGPGAAAVSPPIGCPEAPPMPLATSPESLRAVGALVRATRALPGVRADRVALFGHSRGGGAALHYAVETADIQALVLDSSGYPDEVVAHAARVKAPVLILHGTADGAGGAGSSFTAVERARAFEEALRRSSQPVESRYYDGGEHNGIFTNAEQHRDAVQRIVAFLGRLEPRAETASWPQFRGPDSNPVGGSGRLPDRWSTSENVDWKLEIPGRGWSSPIVTGGKVFLTTVTTDGASKHPQTGTDFSNDYVAELSKQGLPEAEILARLDARDIEKPHEVTLHYFLYCLDVETGAVLWKKEFHGGRPPGGRHRKNSFASETPVTDGTLVYVYVANLGLYAYDLKGDPVWKTALEALPIYLDFGTGGSPVLQGDQLLILSDNEKQQFLAAFDKRTGRPLWRTERALKQNDGPPRQSGWTTPFVWEHPLRTEIVTVGPTAAVSYDLTGRELWRLSGMSIAPVPSPFAYQDLLFVDGGQTRPLFAIRAGAAGDISLPEDKSESASVAWSVPRAGSYIPTPVAYDGALYVLYDKGILARFDARTGAMAYKERLDPEGSAFTSSPWAYDGKIFCLSEEGKTYVVEAGKTFRVLHTNALGDMALATPAIAGDRLILRTEKTLYAIRQKRSASR